MVVYCVGNAFIKRAHFRKNGALDDGLCLDNDEMLAIPRGKGGAYFARGETPFGNFTVAEYVAYHRSTIVGRKIKKAETKYYNRFFAFDLKLNRKMRSLSVSQYRMAQLLSRYTLNARKVFIVFDGVEFSGRENKRLKMLVASLSKYFNVFVSVSDYRFIPLGATVRHYDKDGQQTQIDLSLFTTTKRRKSIVKGACGSFNAKAVVEVSA